MGAYLYPAQIDMVAQTMYGYANNHITIADVMRIRDRQLWADPAEPLILKSSHFFHKLKKAGQTFELGRIFFLIYEKNVNFLKSKVYTIHF